jgi:glutamine synthetase
VVQKDLLVRVSNQLVSITKKLDKVEKQTAAAQAIGDVGKQGAAFRDKVAVALADLRVDIDGLEKITPRDLWPVPVYSDLLFKL